MDLLRSLPIGLYLEHPVSWLHRLDPRVKLIWLLTFMLTPIAANPSWRLSIVGWLLLLTVVTLIPWRVWRQQMGLIFLFSLLLFVVTLVAPDGLDADQTSRLPADELAIALPDTAAMPGDERVPVLSSPQPAVELPQPLGYHYVLFDAGWVKVTRRSLILAIRAGTLLFTLLYSTNLYLMTTAPEEITAGIDNLMQPLRRFKVPVTEIVLTLTLALRFLPLVLEEIQNLVRSVRTRAINWKKLGLRSSSQVWLMVAERLVDNLLLRAEQIASAMLVRGFMGSNQHQVKWHRLRFQWIDWLVLLGAIAFWVARFSIGRT